MSQDNKVTAAKANKAKKTAKAKEIIEGVERKWELKNRIYKLKGKNSKSPFFKLQSEDRPPKKRLMYFDEDEGFQKSIRYAVNHDSPFMRDQEGYDVVQEHIIFKHGHLTVGRESASLQKFLDVHPWNQKNGGSVFYEYDPAAEATKQISAMESEAEALGLAFGMDTVLAEAVLRPIVGPGVRDMKPEVVKHQLLKYAKSKPSSFLQDAKSEKTQIKGVVYAAVDYGIVKITDGGSILRWASNKEKIYHIPFGNEPFEAISEWFMTEDGLIVLNEITQTLKG